MLASEAQLADLFIAATASLHGDGLQLAFHFESFSLAQEVFQSVLICIEKTDLIVNCFHLYLKSLDVDQGVILFRLFLDAHKGQFRPRAQLIQETTVFGLLDGH